MKNTCSLLQGWYVAAWVLQDTFPSVQVKYMGVTGWFSDRGSMNLGDILEVP